MRTHMVLRNKKVRKEQKSVARKFTCCFLYYIMCDSNLNVEVWCNKDA